MKGVLKNPQRHVHNLQLGGLRWSENENYSLSGINDSEKWENGGLLTASLFRLTSSQKHSGRSI